MDVSAGVPLALRVQAIFSNPALYVLAEEIRRPGRASGGKRPKYPDYMIIGFCALTSVFTSARHSQAELTDPHVWDLICETVERMFPSRPDLHLPSRRP